MKDSLNKSSLQTTLKKAEMLEKQGRFQMAETFLGSVCQMSFTDRDLAEFNLRLGAIYGFLNKTELSKNLLNPAFDYYLSINDVGKIVECANYLSLCYWRSGEIDEAVTWLTEANNHFLPKSHYQKLYSFIIESLFDLDNKSFDRIIGKHGKWLKFFQKSGDDYLLGIFFNNLAIAQQELKQFENATYNFETAYQFFENLQHEIYIGAVANNLAQLYRKANRISLAHEFADKSILINRKHEIFFRLGSSLDTKALIFFDERKLSKALETIEESIGILMEAKNHLLLIESFQTKILILTKTLNYKEAIRTTSEAYIIAKSYINKDFAEQVLSFSEDLIRELTPPHINEVYPENVSESLKGLRIKTNDANKHFVVRLKTDCFQTLGLRKDSIAVIEDVPFQTNDLIAVLENGAVVFGFFTTYFNLICLEIPKREPLVFAEEKCRILGKVIGIGIVNENLELEITPL